MTKLLRTLESWSPLRIGIAGGAVLAAIGLLFALLASPAWEQVRAAAMLEAELAEAEGQLASSVDALAASRKELAALKLTAIDAPFRPATIDRLDDRMMALTLLAGEVGVTVDNLEPGATSERGPARVVGLSVGGRGDYRRTLVFLSRLRLDLPDVTVESVRLAASAEGKCSFRLELNWHAARPEVAAVR